MRGIVLMDVDGPLRGSRRDDGFVLEAADQFVMPGAEEAVGLLRDGGFGVALISNQGAAVERGCSPEALLSILQDFALSLGLDSSCVYMCAHPSSVRCDCRKPEPGLLERAVPPELKRQVECIVVGDRWSDIEAGRRFGAWTILVGDYPYERPIGSSTPIPEGLEPPDIVVRNVLEAAYVCTKTTPPFGS